MSYTFRPSVTLCWHCKNAVPHGKYGCSWSEKLIPVEGWTAEKSRGNQGSWSVLECPKYEEDE